MKWTELYRKVNAAASREPNLTDVLNDPVVRAVMRGDGVDPNALGRILGIPIRGRSPGRPDQPRLRRARPEWSSAKIAKGTRRIRINVWERESCRSIPTIGTQASSSGLIERPSVMRTRRPSCGQSVPGWRCCSY